MKKVIIILTILVTVSQLAISQVGEVAICTQMIYEEENSYFPHDYFLEKELGELVKETVKLEQKDSQFILTNTYNDGFTGHEVKIVFNEQLKILGADYEEWTDMINGSETTYTVENIILSTNHNPRRSQNLVGHYTLLIREDFKAGEILSNEGVKDTSYYRTFNGKFKFYKSIEKTNGLKWVKSQNEIKLGIKDSLGVYNYPDEFAEYKHGDKKLKELLSKYKVDRSETEIEHKIFIVVEVTIDESGRIEPESMTVVGKMKSNRVLESLKKDQELMNNWIAGKQDGKSVRSKFNLTVMVNE